MSSQRYKYVIIISEYNGKLLLSRHRNRTTWETQGGHIEPGETPLEAAKRELYEESGAVEFEIEELFDYWGKDAETGGISGGMVYVAKIRCLGEIPESEMAEVRTFDKLPENLTYPEILKPIYKKLLQSRV